MNMAEGKQIHVLYMEDDVGAARLFQKNLERAGYRVDVAHDGREGLSMLQSQAYDIVAVDHTMPYYSGLDVIRIISSRDNPPPTIMITGTGSEAVAVKAMKMGAADYIIKDVECCYMDLLPCVIEKVLLQRRIEEEKNQAEAAMRESEEKYRNLVEHANDGIVMVQDGVVEYANPRLAEITGYSSEEMIGKPFAEYVDSSERLRVLEYHRRRMAGEQVESNYETVISHKDGRKRDVEINTGIVTYGGRAAVLATIRDITDRLQAEAVFRTIAEKSLVGAYIVQDGLFRYLNNNVACYAGYTPEEMIGMEAISIIHPEDREAARKNAIEMLKGMRTVPYEFRVISRDGNVRWIIETVTGIHYRGRPAILANSIDITGRKNMEEELIKIQKLESIGTLAGGIAHDFNNLMTAVLGYISLAKHSLSHKEKVLTNIMKAEAACDRARELTTRLIVFSKGGAPHHRIMQIAPLLEETAVLSLQGRNVSCRFRLPDDLWAVRIDEGQMRQCVHNLLVNAGEAMPEGGIITIFAENITITAGDNLPLKEGNYVKWSVKDYGTGIPPEHLQKIFDPYFTTKPRDSSKGMGLGLAVCYSIIKKHDGHITVESEHGFGSTFHIYLPATETT
jgi:PAS domain S-box-containing protein